MGDPAMTRASGTAMPIAVATAPSVTICSLPAPARNAAMPASSAAPGTSALPPTISARPRSSLSPSSARQGSGKAREQIGVERRDVLHRAATIASGAEVTGAASSISGAAKL